MASMKDQRPSEYAGEQIVWEKLEHNFPDDTICYSHRELNGREFDHCLLIPDIGFVIIEVKGWHAQDIARVDSPDEIWLRGKDASVGSPKKQARGYRFALLGKLQEKYHISPLVMDMVCYPFLTELEYQRAGLQVVSEPTHTLFREDLESERAISRKIARAYREASGVRFDQCKGKVYNACRRFFEPNYAAQQTGYTTLPYSCLSVYTAPLTLGDIEQILRSYFSGIKQVVFVQSHGDLDALAQNLTSMFKRRHLCVQHGHLAFGEQEEMLTVSGNKLSLFQFEAIYVGDQHFSERFTVYNGALLEVQRSILKEIPDKSLFNYDQYCIEHAAVDKDIYVLAGAGTGKTYSMVSRIAFLCHPSSCAGVCVPAEEIVMLTFTVDAAVNMKTRLKLMFMDYFVLTKEAWYLEMITDIEKMRISTIHSFAGEIFKNTSIALGIGANHTTVSGSYERNILFDRCFDQYLTKKNAQGDPLFFEQLPMSIYEFQKCIRQIAGKIYNKGCDIKTLSPEAFGRPPAGMPFMQEIIEQVVIPAEREYEEMLRDNNALHLSEYMIYLRQCIDHEAFNAHQFHTKYLFIDEFQDTDDAQIDAFLSMQEKIGFHFFIVGDLKQSIYRFRGATMDAFQRITKGGAWLDYHLATNYRTDARLLERFNEPFSKMGRMNLLRYRPNVDRLIGVSEKSGIGKQGLVKCLTYPASEENTDPFYDMLFKEITAQKQAIEQRMLERALSLSERTIAILTRTNRQVEMILQEARKRNIQLETSTGGDLYQLQSTLDLCKLTAALCHPYHASYLYDLIRSNNVKVEIDPRLFVGLSEQEKTDLCIRCLDAFYTAKMGMTWQELLRAAHEEPILKVLHFIYEKTMPWKQYSNSVSWQAFYLANYDLLFEELSRMNKKSYLTLDSVNESLHIAVTTGEGKEPRDLENDVRGVRILCVTVHRSKGLEYGTVILPFTKKDGTDSGQNGIEVTYVDGKVGYSITAKSFKKINRFSNSYFDIETEGGEKQMEEARILYVAMTRAIDHFIWCKAEDTSPRSWGGLLEELS